MLFNNPYQHVNAGLGKQPLRYDMDALVHILEWITCIVIIVP